MKQNEERLKRIMDLFEFIKANQPIGIEELIKRYPNISLKTLREYLKVLFSMELLLIDSYRRYSMNDKSKI